MICPGPERANYYLRCLTCGKEYPGDISRLRCDGDHPPSLLRAVYPVRTQSLKVDLPGMFRFYDWLPVKHILEGDSRPVTYRSSGLAESLGLDCLFISFNGYWPERKARMQTCSFKELEAPPTVARLGERRELKLVVASAGNTARAFAHICSLNNIPLYLVVPGSSLETLWLTSEPADFIRLIILGENCDYSDAISLAARLSDEAGMVNEGGVMNVARRDGMGTVVLDAVLTMGEIPDHYFQAVGSGTGGIAAWEANLRLIERRVFGDKKMKLHLSQNHPFTPLYSAWQEKSPVLLKMDEQEAKDLIKKVTAQVLTNRNPPYAITGGVYDALTDTKGEMYTVTAGELETAGEMFAELEGIDICSAASVAVASLVQAVERGTVGRDDCILLNITGGGEKRLKQERPIFQIQPSLLLDDISLSIPEILEQAG